MASNSKKIITNTSDMPYANKKVYELIQSETGGNVKAFAKSINVSQQSLNRIFCIDKRNGKFPSISNEIRQGIIDTYGKDEIWFIAEIDSNGYDAHNTVENDDSPVGVTTQKHGKRIIRYWQDVDATGGDVTLFDDTITNRHIDLSIPEFSDCTDAVNIFGDSMAPLYKSGQIIILKEWTENFIDFGNVYFIITRNGNRMVKYLKKGSDAAHVLCVSENPEFDPFEIRLEDVLKLYIVKGSISKNAL